MADDHRKRRPAPRGRKPGPQKGRPSPPKGKKGPPKPPKADPARGEAFDRLERIERDAAYVGLVSGDADLDPRAMRQASDYVGGVTRWKRWFDWVIDKYYLGDRQGLDPRLRIVLRIGLYDLLHLDTPPYAAINEAVQLAKARDLGRAGGLVNGLLRTVDRQRDKLPLPPTTPRTRHLGIVHSHPDWLVRRWRRRFGEDATIALMTYNNARPVFGVRVNTLKTSPDAFRAALDDAGVEYESSPYLDDFVRVRSLQPILDAGWLQDGTCAVQDESAGLVVRVLDPQPGETIADVCAAPGGKALYAATRMGDDGRVLASDLHENRLNLLGNAAAQHGLSSITRTAADALAPTPDAPLADRVLLDAPCSGLGVLSKRADLRWNRKPEDMDELAALQDRLLDAAAERVSPGGLLMYSTCSIAPEENEHRVRAFLERNASFVIEPVGDAVPAMMRTDDGFFASLPHRDAMDGAFATRLRRR